MEHREGRDSEAAIIDAGSKIKNLFAEREEEVKQLRDEIAELKPLAHEGLPNNCIEGWDEVKFCKIRQGEGNKCKNCSRYNR